MEPPSESFEVAAFRSLFVDAPAQEAAHLLLYAALAGCSCVVVLCSTDAAAVKVLAFPAPYRRIVQDLTLRLQRKRLQLAHTLRARLEALTAAEAHACMHNAATTPRTST